MGQVASLDVKRSPLAAMAERLSIDAAELQSVVLNTVMPSGTKVSNEQLVSFLAVANAYGLDPLKREIFAFPAKGGGIQPIVSIDGWLSIINSRPEFDGMELIENHDDRGALVSVTCKIYRNDRNQPTVVTEYLDECSQNTEPWKQRPRRMLRHKAAIQCSRYAFGLGGIMEEDEGRELGVEREVGPAAAVQPAREPAPLPEYPAGDFSDSLPKWRTLVEGGRATPSQIIEKVQNKYALSAAQLDQIHDLAPIDVEAAEEAQS